MDVIDEEKKILEEIRNEEHKERELLERIENEEKKIETEEKQIRKMEEHIQEEIDAATSSHQSEIIRWKQEIWEHCEFRSEKLSELEVAFQCRKLGKACTYRNCPLKDN